MRQLAWWAVLAATLAVASVVAAVLDLGASTSLGLAAVAFALLSLRE